MLKIRLLKMFYLSLKKWLSVISIVVLLFNQLLAAPLVFAEESTPSAQVTQQASPTPSQTPSPSAEPSLAPSPDVSPIPSVSPTPVPTIEPSAIPVSTPSASPQVTPSPTDSPVGQPNAPPSVSPSPSLAPTSSPTPIESGSDLTGSGPTPAAEATQSASLSATVTKHTTSNKVLKLDLSFGNQTSSATLTTDKSDYSPTDTAIISGSGFARETAYTLEITSSDPPAVDFKTDITTDHTGSFIYSYQLDGNYRPNYQVEVKDSSGTIVATTTFTDAPSTNPLVNNVTSSTVDGSYKAGTTISIQIDFDQSVTVTGTPQLTLSTGTPATTAVNYTSGSGTSTLNFNYTVAAGNTSADLDYSSTSALALNGGTIKGTSGNKNAVLTLATPGTAGSLGANKNIVIDTTAPTLSSVHIQSNNSTTSLAKVGNIITVSFTASESITGTSVTIAGHAASLSGSGTGPYSATYTMASGDTEGAIAFNISGFNDTAGNSGLAVSISTDASSVTFDKTPPVISSLSFTPNSGYGKIGDAITLNITADAAGLSAGAITVNNVVTTGFTNAGGGNYTATYTVVSGNTDRSSGTTPASVVLTDAAGNSNASYTTVAANTLKIDANAPTLVSAQTKTTTTIDVTFSEDINGTTVNGTGTDFTVTGFTVSGASEVTPGIVRLTLGSAMGTGQTPTVNYVGSIKDLAGNVAPLASVVASDGVSPTLSAVSISSNNSNHSFAKVGDKVTLTFTSSESIGTPTVTIAGNSAIVTGGPTAWSASYTLQSGDTEGVVSFNISYTDLNGNIGTASTSTTDSSSVTFDKTPPVTTITSATDGNTNSVNSGGLTKSNSISIVFNATDTNGITSSDCKIDAGSYSACTSPKSYSSLTDGSHTVSIRSTDNAGNVESTATFTWTVDTTAPTLSPVQISSSNANNSWAKIGDNITLTFTTSETLQSTPSATIAGHSVTPTNTSGNNWSASYQMVSGDSEGVIAFNISSFSDLAGNAGTAVSATTDSSSVTFDKTAPGTPAASPVAGSYLSTQSVSLTSSGSSVIRYSTSGTPANCTSGTAYSTPISVSTSTTLFTLACDNAGNTSSASFAYTIGSNNLQPPSSSAGTVSTASTITLNNNASLDLSNGNQAAPGTYTGGDLTNQNLTNPFTVGGQSVTASQEVKITSSGDISLTNADLANVSVNIPNNTTVLAPSGWDGKITPPKTGSSSGTAPSGFSVGGTVIEVGSSLGVLLFDTPVIITLTGVTGDVGYKPAGSSTWTKITTTCSGTYDSPGRPTFPGECAISNGTDTKIYTYHFTTFAKLDAVSSSSSTSSSSSSSGSGGGDGLGCAVHDCSVKSAATQNQISAVLSQPAGAAGFAQGVLGINSAEQLNGNVGLGQVEGVATPSAQQPTATSTPQTKTANSPFNRRVALIVVVLLLGGFGIFKLLFK